MPGDFTADERKAIGLYAVLARDVTDFLDFLPDESDETLRVLYVMLTTPNDKHDEATTELNLLGAGFVESRLKKRGLDLPERPYPSSWERILHG